MGFIPRSLQVQIKLAKLPNARNSIDKELHLEVSNGSSTAEARLVTPNGYTLTAKVSVLIAQKILKGEFTAGYQTPSTAYGKDLILEIDECEFT